MKSFQKIPHLLLDTVIERNNLKNDAALSRALGVAPPVISKIRHGVLPVGATIIIGIHETFNMPIRDIKALIAESDEKVAA